MNNIIRAVFQPGDDTTKAYGLYQWSYGQKLEIHGLDLPRAVEVHFAAVDGTEATVRIGTTVDKVTTVPIPDVLFEQEMDIKAYVYLSDSQSGETIKTVNMPMTPRQKPEGWHGSEETTMGAIMDAINQFADGKADGLDYKDNILKLLSGEKELARVTIAGGASGAAREIELQKSETAIQWRYTGEEEWRDLVLLEDLRGEPGADGTTPHIGDNGNWWIGDTDTGRPSRGEPGADGKTAYQYAQDGGYTGTEGEFAQKLAAEYLTEETDPTVSAWAKKPTKPNYTADEVGADTSGTAENKVSTHNTATDAHSDIRLLVQGLINKLNALADSDDTTLDQMSEVVSYIKSNKSMIDAITTSKVSVTDIIDNLTTNVSNKPLSAAQGVALKALIDGITIPEKLPNPQKLTFAGAVTAEYDGSGAVTVTIPESSGGSGGTVRIEKLSTDTAVELEPNKLYVFPEMAELTLKLAEPADASIANEYHVVFRSGATATTLTIPDTVKTPSGFSIDANKIYELSVMENCMTYQSWDYQAEVTE